MHAHTHVSISTRLVTSNFLLCTKDHTATRNTYSPAEGHPSFTGSCQQISKAGNNGVRATLLYSTLLYFAMLYSTPALKKYLLSYLYFVIIVIVTIIIILGEMRDTILFISYS